MKALIAILIALPTSIVAQGSHYVLSPYFVQNETGYEGPFLFDSNQAGSIRYQQVYGASDFGIFFAPGPVQITEVTFCTGAGALNVNLANVRMDLSTTQKQPDGLSAAF